MNDHLIPERFQPVPLVDAEIKQLKATIEALTKRVEELEGPPKLCMHCKKPGMLSSEVLDWFDAYMASKDDD